MVGVTADAPDRTAEAYQESERCQGHPSSAIRRALAGPVDPLDTAAASKRIRYLLLQESPAAVPIIRLARKVFGAHVESGDADWRWVERECKRQGYPVVHPPTRDVAYVDGKWVNQETEAELLWVYPVFDDAESVLDNGSKQKGPRHSSARSTALTRGRGVVKRRQTLDTAAVWAVLVGAFGAKRLGEEIGAANGTPTATRFNDSSRASSGVDRVRGGFEAAADAGHRRGAVVTPTTDPKQFDSVADASAGLLDDVKRLRKKLGRSVGGGMPPSVVAVEPTERGVPHAHVAVFGVDPAELPTEHELHNYWHERRGRGFQVHVDPIEVRDGRWVWAEASPSRAAGCPPSAYLSQGVSAIAATARLDSSDVQAVADAYRALGDETVERGVGFDRDALDVAVGVNPESVRTAAWFWATDLRAATCSPSLRKA